MRVHVAVKGRFHAFTLARELQRRGHLVRLITSYPKWLACRDGLPRERVRSLPWIEIAARALHHCHAPRRLLHLGERHLLAAFDRGAAQQLGAGDLCVAWSGSARLTLRRARELGMVTVLERGSCHIETQRELLRDCHLQAAAPDHELVPDHAVAQELAEYQEADYICVPSSFARASFVARGIDPARILSVPLCVDITRFTPAAGPAGRFRILHVGAVSRQKGCHQLLAAFTALGSPSAELRLVGPILPELHAALAAAGTNVHALGAMPAARLPEQYRSAAVFVLASIQDGFGQVLLQAMASGLPVVASRNSGAPDVIRDGIDGLLFDAGDVATLAAHLQRLHRDPELRLTMGRNARERALDFRSERYGDRIVAAYRRCLAPTPPITAGEVAR